MDQDPDENSKKNCDTWPLTRTIIDGYTQYNG